MSFTLSFMHSCSTDEILLQNDSNIQTVSREEAIQFLQQNPLKGSGNKTSKTTTLSNYDAITLEKITNSDQLLTVIPLPDNDKQQNSRVLLLTVNDTLKSAVFTMYPDVDQSTKEFSGRVLITSMSGDFFKGFRMKNGYIISKFIKETSLNKTNKIESKSTLAYATEPIKLHEVIIPARKPVQSLTVAYLYVYSWEIESSSYSDLYWGFGGGGGGSGGSAEPVVEDPCDQLKTQNSNTDYLSKIQSLKKNTGLKNETGFIENKDGTFKDLINTTNDGLDIPKDANTIGFNHTHIDDYESGDYDEDGNAIINQPIKIFSPKDVMTFIILLNNANRQNISLGSIYGKVISSSNTYTLKFEGVISDINQSIPFDKVLDRNYQKAIKKNGLENGFLQFLQDTGIKGVSLYKVNTDGTAEKKSLDANNNIVTTPCS
ncbi:hypothetical protein [Flavobacterium xanthum]|uniref:Uncharacterized protein n=1 Tax=Flavobacterium xanthum TaxID=69322 RepID=A0A1M7HRS3_9FLAO|nr:hypothetical protein [Flavobacterium xanthum]SHM31184.1 hypothetical protein SAMN05443669_10305 [Flavobacterium xanthum]